MHKNHLEAVQLTQKTAWALTSDDTEAVEVVVCPPFTALRSVGTLIEGDRLAIRLGAQDCHPEPQGAYTGEVSAPMLAKLACGYVSVGHSERRQYFGESDELGSRKARAGRPPRSSRGRSGAPWPGSAPSRSVAWWSPTSRSGRSAPAARPPPGTPRRPSPWSVRPSPSWPASPPPRPSGSSTAAASRPLTSRA